MKWFARDSHAMGWRLVAIELFAFAHAIGALMLGLEPPSPAMIAIIACAFWLFYELWI